MAAIKQSERVREIVRTEYVEKARRLGQNQFSVCARDVLKKAEEAEDFPRARTPLICTVLQSKKLLDENRLVIENIEGPPSRQSRKVIVHYRMKEDYVVKANPVLSSIRESTEEDPQRWAERLTSRILGVMKDEIKAHGGTEGYLRWVRSEDDEEGA